jgi:hypothetical protein
MPKMHTGDTAQNFDEWDVGDGARYSKWSNWLDVNTHYPWLVKTIEANDMTIDVSSTIDSSSMNLEFPINVHVPSIHLGVSLQSDENQSEDEPRAGWSLGTQSFVLSLGPNPDNHLERRRLSPEPGSFLPSQSKLRTNVSIGATCPSTHSMVKNCSLFYPAAPIASQMFKGRADFDLNFNCEKPNFFTRLFGGPNHTVSYQQYPDFEFSSPPSSSHRRRALSVSSATSYPLLDRLANQQKKKTGVYKCFSSLMDNSWSISDGCFTGKCVIANLRPSFHPLPSLTSLIHSHARLLMHSPPHR